jgi:pantoate--beta-alanine ligase
VQADVAVFGRKDLQQLAVIRRMVRDLLLPVRIRAHETVREPNSVAMSSRNRYLTAEQLAKATAIPAAMEAAKALARAGVDLAVAVTGVAGPGGGSEAKPVGLVHVALAARNRPTLHRECRFGPIGRGAVRVETVKTALDMLHDQIATWQETGHA